MQVKDVQKCSLQFFLHLCSKLEITQISVYSRMDKNWGVYLYSGILHSQEKQLLLVMW